MEKDNKPVWGMIGEFMREAAVLVMVFGFLDRLVDPDKQRHLTLAWSLLITSTTAFLLFSGILVEKWRR